MSQHVMQSTLAQPCAQCGYDLRAAKKGQPCPECGLHDDPLAYAPLAHMPLDIVRRFRNGSLLAAFCIVALVILGATGIGMEGFNGVVIGFALPCVALWPVAIIMMTPAYPLRAAVTRGFNERSRLRTIARVSQFAWPVACVFAVLAMRVPALRIPMLIALIVAFLGLIAVAVLMERLSEWVCDTTAERAFNWAIWTLPVSVALSFASMSIGPSGVLLAMSAVIVVFMASSFLAMPAGFFSLAVTMFNAVINAREHQDAMERRRIRQSEYHDDLASRIDESI